MRFWKKRYNDDPADEAATGDAARYEYDLVSRMIAEGRDPDTDPEFLSYMAEKSTEPMEDSLSGNPKYRLVEMPEYLEGRMKMTRAR